MGTGVAGRGEGVTRPSWVRAAAAAAAAALAVASPAGAGSRHPTPRAREEVPVTAVRMGRPQANNSPSLAADPTDGRVLALAARLDGPDFGCSLHLSGDTGRTWVPAAPVPELPAGAEKCYAGDVVFDRRGGLHYLFVGLRGLGNHPMGAFLATSTDRGRTFGPPRKVLRAHSYMVAMAIDAGRGRHGRLHVAWVQATADPSTGGFPPVDNPVLARHSDDGGATWSRPVRVSDRARARVVGPALAVGRGGALHALYWDLQDDARDYQGLEGPAWEGTWSLVLATSPDGGGRFRPGVVVDGAVRPPERLMVVFTSPPPALAADGRGGVVAAWADARHGDWDVLARRSRDDGRTWGRPVRVNDDPPGSGRHQYLPRLAAGPGDRVDAVYYDRRADPANLATHVSFATSADGGRRFAPSVRLTSEASDPRQGPVFPALASARGLVEFGSRLALLPHRHGALAAWTDTRTPEPRQHQAIVAGGAAFHTPPSGRDGGAGWLLPAGGAGAAALLAAALARRQVRRPRASNAESDGTSPQGGRT